MNTASRVRINPLSFAEVHFKVRLQLLHLEQQMGVYRLVEIVTAA